ncbi:DNA alkylation repair protein [Roseimaritima ulvae]|uniref:DNA alkylation repair enzyme n=1 Tax=Roseimaritima ulvae TaxID=980254 RepID=A0A5B9QNV1_9BACT|nr:DNA alkylation repair protein [Roseimaritima ulvae]QEG39165.1 hypothetical protein UC8_11260 [Roseimaritima ulvae]
MTSKTKGTGFSLKDQLINRQRVQYLAELFHAADESFDAAGFQRAAMKGLKPLELKQRIVHLASTLEGYLATDFRIAAKQITAALPPPLDPTKSDDDFGDFIMAPLGEYVVRNGMQKKHVKLSLRTLKQITQRFSMEDAIRAFINQYPGETMAELQKWAKDKNYHVRRLVSEGTRPRLPWSGRLSLDPAEPLPLLDILHADPTRYVTRSVANHLNDIAKTEPQWVLDALRRWQQAGRQRPSELQWISRHALRTLVKQGHRPALEFLGFRTTPKIEVSDFELHAEAVRPGDLLEFSFVLTAQRTESLLVDYVIDFVKANGTLAPKVHKLKQLQLKKDESVMLKKRHRLHAAATTYTLYPGQHHVTLQINGKPYGKQSFMLE